MPFFDKEEIKSAHNIVDVATKLGLKLTKKGEQYRGICPSGQGGERALVITPSKASWYSFGINKGGDLIALVQLVRECSFQEACAWLQGDKSVSEPEKKQNQSAEQPERRANTEVVEKPSEGFKPLPYLVPDHPSVLALGFDPSFAEEMGLGYSPRGVMRGLVALPVRDCNGVLRGYVGIQEARLPSSWC